MDDRERQSNLVWLGIFGFVLALAMTHILATLMLAKGVNSRLAAIKAKGGVVSSVEYADVQVPPAENAATYYEQAFLLVDGLGAREDFDKLSTFLIPSELAKDPKLLDEARAIVRKYEQVFPLVEQASTRPKCWFQANWQTGSSVMFPHYMKMRRLSQLLAAKARLLAIDGRMEEAGNSVGLGFKTATSLKEESNSTGFLVHTILVRYASSCLREVLQHGDISESQARAIYETLAVDDLDCSLVKAIKGDRALGVCVFDEARRNPSLLRNMSSTAATSQDNPGWQIAGYLWQPALNKDEQFYLDHYERLLSKVHLSWREVKMNPSLEVPEPNVPPYAIVSNVLCPYFTHRKSRDEAIAAVSGSQIILALNVYKRRYSSYPSDLNTLRKRLGWKIPLDPFSGKDFVYKPKAKGFLLYSLGADLKDDGARPLPPGTRGGDYTDQQGRKVDDIVWVRER